MDNFKAGDRIFVDQNHINWWNKKWVVCRQDNPITNNRGRVSSIICKSTANLNIEFDNYPTVVMVPSCYVHPLSDPKQVIYTFGDAVRLDSAFVESWNYEFEKRIEFLHPKLDTNLGTVTSIVSPEINCNVLVKVDGCKRPIPVPKKYLFKLTN